MYDQVITVSTDRPMTLAQRLRLEDKIKKMLTPDPNGDDADDFFLPDDIDEVPRLVVVKS
jgi:hypothetical protein